MQVGTVTVKRKVVVRVEVVLQVGTVTVKEKGSGLSRGSIASRNSNSKRERWLFE